MKRVVALLIALPAAGCSSTDSALKPSPDRPAIVTQCPRYTALKPSPDRSAVIYAIPQAQAFAMARQAIRTSASSYADYVSIDEHVGHLRGYNVLAENLIAHRFRQQLYVMPVAGAAASGQEIDGFRFEIGSRGPWVLRGSPLQGAVQDCLLASTLEAALDATGSAAIVTHLRTRPFVEGGAKASLR